MKIGAVFSQADSGTDPELIRRFARTAEDEGFRHLMAYDHVLKTPHEGREPKLTGPYTERETFHDPFVLFGFLSACTQAIEFSTQVMVLPQRQTALVAKQAACLDVLSGGRFRFGIGIGWNPVEYLGLNEDFKNRGKRSEEQVEVLRALWAEPHVAFKGRWRTIDDAGINPLPRRRGRGGRHGGCPRVLGDVRCRVRGGTRPGPRS